MKVENKDTIDRIQPKPYERVGNGFILSGRVPESWLKTSWGSMDYRIFLDFLDGAGLEFMGVSVDVFDSEDGICFATRVRFNETNASFIAKFQGRIAIRLKGQEESHSFFLPLIIDGYEPENGLDPEIERRHRNLGSRILQYENDLKIYNQELLKIINHRVYDAEILEGIFKILQESKSEFNPFFESEEDREMRVLAEKYKEAIEWRGPMLGGRAGTMEGFEFRVYSNDHGKHFHVIHKGRGIDARFSFPEIELIDYKSSKNIIGSKEKDKIYQFFKKPDNFQRLDSEFQKRQ